MPHPSQSAAHPALTAQLTPEGRDPAIAHRRRASSGARTLDPAVLIGTAADFAEAATWLEREGARFEALAREAQGRTPPSQGLASSSVTRHPPELTMRAAEGKC